MMPYPPQKAVDPEQHLHSSAVERQTAVTAYFPSKQLPPFAITSLNWYMGVLIMSYAHHAYQPLITQYSVVYEPGKDFTGITSAARKTKINDSENPWLWILPPRAGKQQ